MNSRAKGGKGEREFSALCRDNGWNTRRSAQYCGASPDASDVIGLPGVYVEVKRTERTDFGGWMLKASADCGSKVPIIAWRKNHSPWLIVMRAGDWFDMAREWLAEREGNG